MALLNEVVDDGYIYFAEQQYGDEYIPPVLNTKIAYHGSRTFQIGHEDFDEDMQAIRKIVESG